MKADLPLLSEVRGNQIEFIRKMEYTMPPYKQIETTEFSELKDVRKKLYVKYMVSLHCKMIAKTELEKLDIKHKVSANGSVEINDEVTPSQLDMLKVNLQMSGLDVLDEHSSLVIDKLIKSIIDIIHHSDNLPKINFSDLIHESLLFNNESILGIFSEVKGVSVIQFIITQKIEKVKELLLYSNDSLSEIADKLHYKNEKYLIAQLKKYTGLTPAFFRDLKYKREKNCMNGCSPA